MMTKDSKKKLKNIKNMNIFLKDQNKQICIKKVNTNEYDVEFYILHVRIKQTKFDTIMLIKKNEIHFFVCLFKGFQQVTCFFSIRIFLKIDKLYNPSLIFIFNDLVGEKLEDKLFIFS
jgi:hypothetical protein